MLSRAMILGFSLIAGAASAARADHLHEFFFRATVTSVEGTPPFALNVGDTLYTQYLFDSTLPDSDPFPGVGQYVGTMRDSYTSVGGLNFRDIFGPITVIDNSALGDVYRVRMANQAGTVSVAIDLIDAESGAANSDVNPTTLDVNLYLGEFDVATVVVEAPSPFPAPPGSTFRATATIENIKAYSVYCRCDWNRDDRVDSQDFFDYLSSYFTGGGDYNYDGIANTQDFFDFLTCFFSPEFSCP